ncbi:hypothetical protein Taro_013390 [Colocasia esculenta]|uniref:HAT C-terminal dimerisation domain-containing protein n=1 Tax=Colocasia esculenta TaxID=4460 RepID=A0A843UFF3_COLES|nr:hypothetical protein [Colocasia esculenta]
MFQSMILARSHDLLTQRPFRARFCCCCATSESEMRCWFGWCVLEGFSQSGALVVLVEVLPGPACVASAVLLTAVSFLMVRVVWVVHSGEGSSQDRPLSLLVEVLPRSALCLFWATVVLPLWFEVCRLVGLRSGEVLPGWLLALFVEVLPKAASRMILARGRRERGAWSEEEVAMHTRRPQRKVCSRVFKSVVATRLMSRPRSQQPDTLPSSVRKRRPPCRVVLATRWLSPSHRVSTVCCGRSQIYSTVRLNGRLVVPTGLLREAHSLLYRLRLQSSTFHGRLRRQGYSRRESLELEYFLKENFSSQLLKSDLDTPVLGPCNENFDIIVWWKENEGKYPILAIMALDTLGN